MTVVYLIGGTVLAVAGSFLADRHPVFGLWWFGLNAIVCVVVAVISVVQREWGWAAWMIACAAMHGWWWNQSRRKRKRRSAFALAGAKSRARIQALVARQRAAQRRTRPVLRPVPSGAA